jgi:hypothetical protein
MTTRRDSGGGLAHLLLGQPDIAEQYMRALALKGQLPSYTGGEFEPSITVLDLTQPEFLWLRRIVRVQQSVSLTATAAQFSQIALAPIAGAARVMAVVEKLIITNTTAGALHYFVDFLPNSLVAAAPNVPKSAMDDRAIPFNAPLQTQVSLGIVNATAAAAIIGSGGILVATAANTTVVLDLNAIFTARLVNTTPSPSLLMVQGTALNLPLQVSFIWRERTLLATESL